MKAAGRKAADAARRDVAYDSPGDAAVPKDFLKALAKNAKAKACFATLNSQCLCHHLAAPDRKKTGDAAEAPGSDRGDVGQGREVSSIARTAVERDRFILNRLIKNRSSPRMRGPRLCGKKTG